MQNKVFESTPKQSVPDQPAREQMAQEQMNDKLTRRASFVSLGSSLIILAFKFWGYHVTGSQAVFSDAMESIVNVVAAGLALIVVAIALKPADEDHPYGHGKVEYFSAAFEGGLIAFAAMMICFEAIQAMISGVTLNQLGFGIAVVLGSGLANAALGFFLMQIGRRHHSAALMASGEHVLSDFWTSAGVGLGLILVHFTGIWWIDPLVALIVGALLGFTGIKLVRRSIGGLLDAEDPGILEHLLEVVTKERSTSAVIQLHHCRVIRSGRYHHIDAHAVIPEFWNVAKAHEETAKYEANIIRSYRYTGELHLHIDPCRRAYCQYCDLQDCPIRQMPFKEHLPLSLDDIRAPDEPSEFRE
jgi:cation diffusion facilitator family transporter